MPLRDDLLTPIPGDNPSGVYVRHDTKLLLYDKIKEARRQDDELAQGDWQHERKMADYELDLKRIVRHFPFMLPVALRQFVILPAGFFDLVVEQQFCVVADVHTAWVVARNRGQQIVTQRHGQYPGRQYPRQSAVAWAAGCSK